MVKKRAFVLRDLDGDSVLRGDPEHTLRAPESSAPAIDSDSVGVRAGDDASVSILSDAGSVAIRRGDDASVSIPGDDASVSIRKGDDATV